VVAGGVGEACFVAFALEPNQIFAISQSGPVKNVVLEIIYVVPIAYPLSMLTISEQLFEEFCRRVKIRCERVPEGDARTPDYDVFLDGLRVVVEIKEIDLPVPDSNGVTGFTVGQAARNAIKKASKQIKARADHRVPGVIVLFEERWMQLESHNILHAMYGAHTVDIAVPQDMSVAPTIRGHRLGAGRQMTEEQNTSIGAVAHLECLPSDGISLTVYHNRYARLPIAPERFAAYGIKQYVLPEADGYGLPEWHEVHV
jgi:hypothetical protein